MLPCLLSQKGRGFLTNLKKFMKINRQNRSPHSDGFTLLEVLVVLFIIVSMAGLAVVAVLGRLDRANVRTAYAYIKTLETAVKGYEIDMGRAPTNEQGLSALQVVPGDVHNPGSWAGPYIESTASSRDPWGNEYRYASPGRDGRSFDIWSVGKDGIDGTDDDIGSWMPRPD
jgi:general secretion pathway protein G